MKNTKSTKNKNNNEYLSNPICKFTPIRVRNITENKNIVSASFFKIESGAYKNFSLYINGIKHINEYMSQEMKDFTFRLFIEDSIIEDKKLMDYLLSIKSIDLVKFECSAYKSSLDSSKHRGIFSMFVRFFPLFDFPNNDADIVIISDIDYTSYKEVKSRFLGTMNKLYKEIKNKSFFKDTYLTYTRFLSKDDAIDRRMVTPLKYPTIVSSRIMGKKKIPSHLIIDYIQTADDKKKRLTNYSHNNDSKIANKTFMFGVDEYLLNHDVIEYLDQHKLQFIIVTQFGLGDMIYYKFVANKRDKKLSYKGKSEIEKVYLTELLKFCMKEVPNFKFQNITQAYIEIDKYTYVAEKNLAPMTPIQLNIFFRLYLFLMSTYKYALKKNIFSKKELNLALSNHFLGYVFKSEYVVHGEKKYVRIIKEYKLPQKYITILKQLKNDFGLKLEDFEPKHLSGIDEFFYNSNFKQFIKNTNNFNKKTDITPTLQEELSKINELHKKYYDSDPITIARSAHISGQ